VGVEEVVGVVLPVAPTAGGFETGFFFTIFFLGGSGAVSSTIVFVGGAEFTTV
jgi:hypothetical protein